MPLDLASKRLCVNGCGVEVESDNWGAKYCAACRRNGLRKKDLRRKARRKRLNQKVYRRYLGPHCERCGFKPEAPGQLDVHHRDGDHHNNDPLNLGTLCANCHRVMHRLGPGRVVTDYRVRTPVVIPKPPKPRYKPLEHGTRHGYNVYKCRCEPCRLAYAEGRQALRKRHRLDVVPGSLPSFRHGTVWAYRELKCRCEPCRQAYLAKREPYLVKRGRRRERYRAAIVPGITKPIAHGLAQTFRYRGCRCEPCTTAHSKYQRDGYLRRRSKLGDLTVKPTRPLFTSRQLEALRALVEGLTFVDMATRLGITYNTTVHLVQELYRKLGVPAGGARRRPQAVRIALERGLVHKRTPVIRLATGELVVAS